MASASQELRRSNRMLSAKAGESRRPSSSRADPKGSGRPAGRRLTLTDRDRAAGDGPRRHHDPHPDLLEAPSSPSPTRANGSSLITSPPFANCCSSTGSDTVAARHRSGARRRSTSRRRRTRARQRHLLTFAGGGTCWPRTTPGAGARIRDGRVAAAPGTPTMHQMKEAPLKVTARRSWGSRRPRPHPRTPRPAGPCSRKAPKRCAADGWPCACSTHASTPHALPVSRAFAAHTALAPTPPRWSERPSRSTLQRRREPPPSQSRRSASPSAPPDHRRRVHPPPWLSSSFPPWLRQSVSRVWVPVRCQRLPGVRRVPAQQVPEPLFQQPQPVSVLPRAGHHDG